MSSNDKTRQKLVESMRKTKAAAKQGEDKNDEQDKTGTRHTASSKKNVTAKKTPSNTTTSSLNDPYQSCSRRVWPD